MDDHRGGSGADGGPPQPRRLGPFRPVDLLPVAFLATITVAASLSPYPMAWDPTTIGAWAVLTVIAGLIIAAPSVVRFERDFLRPVWANLPGHALLIVLGVTALFFAPRFLLHPATAVIVALMALMSAALGRKKRELFTLRRLAVAWLPALLSFFVYENLRSFIGALSPQPVDDALAALDLKLFGAHHTVLLEPLIRPWLTEWMTFNYGLYLLYPVLTGMLFYYHERRRAFDDFVLAFCLSMYVGFLCYLAVPAVGPIQGLGHLYHTSLLPGTTYAEFQLAVLEKYRYVRDAFPSLHVANSLLCLIFLWRRYPRVARVMAFFEINLIASTIYLRMHYTIDVVAGAALAFAVAWAAPRINRWAGVGAGEERAALEPGAGRGSRPI